MTGIFYPKYYTTNFVTTSYCALGSLFL